MTPDHESPTEISLCRGCGRHTLLVPGTGYCPRCEAEGPRPLIETTEEVGRCRGCGRQTLLPVGADFCPECAAENAGGGGGDA